MPFLLVLTPRVPLGTAFPAAEAAVAAGATLSQSTWAPDGETLVATRWVPEPVGCNAPRLGMIYVTNRRSDLVVLRSEVGWAVSAPAECTGAAQIGPASSPSAGATAQSPATLSADVIGQ